LGDILDILRVIEVGPGDFFAEVAKRLRGLEQPVSDDERAAEALRSLGGMMEVRRVASEAGQEAAREVLREAGLLPRR
jgi:hypothetical protein